MLEYHNFSTLICGLNARVSNAQPLIDTDIDKYLNNDPCNSQLFYTYNDNLERCSEDKIYKLWKKSRLNLQ